ncbi:hypothetical protein M404DRAFT_302870 [Pisolithus tinctorius Marx 270]|uniref:Uncharacterized protein n=1 Tax=Pisolithus tinctorius Marx 270 TaxID=870435 RepID=A0A0C3JIP5_PISTI|nr:hypothetical protein M404DRAFT_302870 [Pisolithus tinctorius Marx 270]
MGRGTTSCTEASQERNSGCPPWREWADRIVSKSTRHRYIYPIGAISHRRAWVRVSTGGLMRIRGFDCSGRRRPPRLISR